MAHQNNQKAQVMIEIKIIIDIFETADWIL